MTPPCDILIPVYNGYTHVQQCLSSVLATLPTNCRVIILDDASTDIQLIEWLHQQAAVDSRVCVISHAINLGFVGNVNRGLAIATGDVIILNSDTIVTPDWITQLYRCANSAPTIGIVCPLSNHATILSVPYMNRANRLPSGFSLTQFAALIAHCAQPQYPRIPVAVGFCMLIRAAVLQRVGLLHTAFHRGYGEECDFSLRTWQAGFEIVCCDECFVYHAGEVSFGAIAGMAPIKQRNAIILETRWPFYTQLIQRYCQLNPLLAVQERIKTALCQAQGDDAPPILQVLHAYTSLGGTELHSRQIIEHIADDWRITVLFPDTVADHYSAFEVIEQREGVRVLKYRKQLLEHDWVLFGHSATLHHADTEYMFAQLVRGGQIRLVHFQHLLGWRTLALPLIAKAAGARVVISLHDYYLFCPIYDLLLPNGQPCGKYNPDHTDSDCLACLTHYSHPPLDTAQLANYMTERRAILLTVFQCCDHMIAPSQYVKTQFARVYGAQLATKVQIITHGIPALGQPFNTKSPHTVRIGIIANMTRRKGADIVIAAAQQLRQLLPPTRFTLSHYGGASPHYTTQLAAAGIHSAGSYTLATLPGITATLDLAIVPSIYAETFCLTVAELQSLGVPVIAFAVGAISERIQDGRSGFLVHSINATALAKRIAQLIRDRRSLARVRHYLTTTWRIKSIITNSAEYSAVYRQLLNETEPTPATVDLTPFHTIAAPTIPALFTALEPQWHQWQQGYGQPIYRRWLAQQTHLCRPPPTDEALLLDILITVLDHNTDDLIATLTSVIPAVQQGARVVIISQTITESSLPPVTLPPLCWVQISPAHDSARALNQWIAAHGREWLFILPSGDQLAAAAPLFMHAYTRAYPAWRCVYTDADYIADDGRRYQPLFKPDANLELLRSQDIIGPAAFIHRTALLTGGGFTRYPAAALYDVALNIIDHNGLSALGHIPAVLYHRHDRHLFTPIATTTHAAMERALAAHLTRQRLIGTIQRTDTPGIVWIDYPTPRHLTFTLIITTNGDGEQVAATIDNVRSIAARFHVIIVEYAAHSAIETVLMQRQRDVTIEILRVHTDESIAAALNRAIDAAPTELICMSHDGMRFHTRHALSLLWGLLTRPAVAIAAPCILDTTGHIVAGYFLTGFWPFGATGQLHAGATLARPGYLQRNLCVQNCITVSERFCVIRRSAFRQINGLDATPFPSAWYWLDAGLRLTHNGYTVVWTPHATVVEHHPGSFAAQQRDMLDDHHVALEVAHLYDRWLAALAHDPHYNPHLTLRDFSAEPEVQLVRTCDPVVHANHPRLLGFPGDDGGSGHYRVRDPFDALHTQHHACTMCLPPPHTARVPNIVELTRLNPTTLLLHNALHDQQLHALALYQRYSGALRIFSLDDLITDIPDWNPFHQRNYPDLERRLHQALERCDRLLVSTAALAAAYADYHADIRIVPNGLAEWRWCPHGPPTRANPVPRRPRIGWAGAMQHAADLAWLLPVVTALAAEADWHFFGDCPAALRPHVSSVTPMVDFNDYPHTLAALEIDVAIAPLVLHDFNRCKSPLRLLEWGILGVPVVCTAIEPYQLAPVERLPNAPAHWIAALRARIHDRAAARIEGVQLQRWVSEHGLLTQQIAHWLAALT